VELLNELVNAWDMEMCFSVGLMIIQYFATIYVIFPILRNLKEMKEEEKMKSMRSMQSSQSGRQASIIKNNYNFGNH
jgi:hypothetical protein